MNIINKEQHDELIKILSELIEIIVIMRKEEKDYVLAQNESEAREWISFLREHEDKEELKSLEDEISNRFFSKFDVQISEINENWEVFYVGYMPRHKNFGRWTIPGSCSI